MNAKAKVLATSNHASVGRNHRVLPDRGFEVATLNAVNDAKLHATPVGERTMPETIGMVFAAPLIGLACVMALPFIGIYYLAKLALEAYANRAPATSEKMKKTRVMARNLGLFLSAPFIALAYVIALPIVGCFMIARLAMEAHGKPMDAGS